MIDFRKGEPNLALSKKKLLLSALTPSLYEYNKLFYYTTDNQGIYELRETISELLNCPYSKPENLIITNGVLSSIDMLVRLFIDDIDEFYVFEPTYWQPLALLKQFGKPIRSIPVQSNGDINDAVLTSFLKKNVRYLFYVIPNLNNPDSQSLTLKNRQILARLSLLQKNQVRIIQQFPS